MPPSTSAPVPSLCRSKRARLKVEPALHRAEGLLNLGSGMEPICLLNCLSSACTGLPALPLCWIRSPSCHARRATAGWPALHNPCRPARPLSQARECLDDLRQLVDLGLVGWVHLHMLDAAVFAVDCRVSPVAEEGVFAFSTQRFTGGRRCQRVWLARLTFDVLPQACSAGDDGGINDGPACLAPSGLVAPTGC